MRSVATWNLGAIAVVTLGRVMPGVGGWIEEEIVREFGMGMYTLLYLKWITNKDLLYSTRNSA